MKIFKINKKNLEDAVSLECGLTKFESRFDKKLKVDMKKKNEVRKALLKAIKNKNELLLMAVHNGENIAIMTGSIEKKYIWRTSIGYLCDLYVKPEYRKKGIGKLLLKEFEKWLRMRGIKYVELTTYDANIGAKTAYGRMGFKPYTLRMIKRL